MMFQIAAGILISLGVFGGLAMIGEAIDGAVRRSRVQSNAEKAAKGWRAYRERQLYGPIEDLKAELDRTTNERQRTEIQRLIRARQAYESNWSGEFWLIDPPVLAMLRDVKARAKWQHKTA